MIGICCNTSGTVDHGSHLSASDAVDLIIQIEKLIEMSGVSLDTKEEAIAYLGAARKAAQKDNPNKQITQINLKEVCNTLEVASKTVESGKSLWENVKPILIQLVGWLGVAKGFFGL